jgi:hypothetical protein
MIDIVMAISWRPDDLGSIISRALGLRKARTPSLLPGSDLVAIVAEPSGWYVFQYHVPPAAHSETINSAMKKRRIPLSFNTTPPSACHDWRQREADS